jgi:aminoglycoside/choline kinase family phosphotransferase
MTERACAFDAFLADHGWAKARVTPIKQDASKRIFYRLSDPASGTAILMQIPPDAAENPKDIIRLTQHLRGIGLGAPEILAINPTQTLMITEDLGERRFADEFIATPQLQFERYISAVDMLAHLRLHGGDIEVPLGDPETLAAMIDPVFQYYCVTAIPDRQRQDLTTHLYQILKQNLTGKMTLSLRDCHAENLIWAGHKSGIAKVGIIDFQDAFLTHPAYDLVSLLYDVRRDIAPDLRAKMVEHYIQKTQDDLDQFGAAMHAINVQRNLRILGVFAKLAKQGRPHYLAWADRTWRYIQEGLTHQTLAPLGNTIHALIPEPTADHIAWLTHD